MIVSDPDWVYLGKDGSDITMNNYLLNIQNKLLEKWKWYPVLMEWKVPAQQMIRNRLKNNYRSLCKYQWRI